MFTPTSEETWRFGPEVTSLFFSSINLGVKIRPLQLVLGVFETTRQLRLE
jgi:formylmethanofuran dehydrogenase subunit A